MTKSRKIINEIKYWDTKLKEKKKQSREWISYLIYKQNKSNENELNKKKI
jgi:hypothetical protein